MNDTTIWFVLGGIVLLLVVGCVRRNPLALWIVETLTMFAVFAVGKSLFGTKGYVRGYTGRPRLRK
jgi:uncharacterized membrane protein SirB2